MEAVFVALRFPKGSRLSLHTGFYLVYKSNTIYGLLVGPITNPTENNFEFGWSQVVVSTKVCLDVSLWKHGEISMFHQIISTLYAIYLGIFTCCLHFKSLAVRLEGERTVVASCHGERGASCHKNVNEL